VKVKQREKLFMQRKEVKTQDFKCYQQQVLHMTIAKTGKSKLEKEF